MSSSQEASLRVLFVASESVPVVKTGGLADVVGALPKALASEGCEVRVVLPFYRSVRESGVPCRTVLEGMPVEVGGESRPADVLQTFIDDRTVCYLIRQDEFFDRTYLYGPPEGGYPDNDLRYICLCRAVFSLCRALSYFPDVMHCHDWQAAMVPAYLRFLYGRSAGFGHTRSLLTIHNLAYQGLFPAETFPRTGLPGTFFTPEGMEFWGNANFLKAGIVSADRISTVSPTYSREILSPEFGCGLEGVLSGRAGDLHGILNGADYQAWDPARDLYLAARYDPDRLEAKQKCKESLIREMGIRPEAEKQPLFGMISRLTAQKGVDLVVAAAREMLDLGVHCVILGEGEERYRADCESLVRRFPGRFSVRFGFDNALAHRIQAGSDFLMMPSRFEPCGLNQIYAMRYGTVPVVKATGGLRDTVTEFVPGASGEGTGFLFEHHDPGSFLEAVKKAVRVRGAGGSEWDRIRSNGMNRSFSWARSAREYRRLYEELRCLP